MGLADRRAATFVTIKNLENDPKAREFEILHRISWLRNYTTSVTINLPQMPDSWPVSQSHARPSASSENPTSHDIAATEGAEASENL